MEQCSAYVATKRIDELFPAESIQRVRVAPMAAAVGAVAGRLSDEENLPVAPNRNNPLAFTLKDVNPSHPMIQKRGISVETAERFGLGFFPGKGSMASRIVFPLHGDGNIVGYAGRTTLPVSDANPKWLFGKGLKKTFLYGMERCDPAKRLLLCESLWAPLWFHEHGLQAAALMGSEMTEAQELCLRPYLLVTVALDNDAAGMEKADRIRGRLKENHRVSKARLIGWRGPRHPLF
jgi:Toprim-like